MNILTLKNYATSSNFLNRNLLIKTNFYKNPNFKFTKRVMGLTQKMKLIMEKEQASKKGNEEEILFSEEKTIPLIKMTQKIRLPIYLIVPCLIWTSPVTVLYHGLLLFSNYYLIFLSTFEATSLFSMGLNQYNLTIGDYSTVEKEKEFIKMRSTVIRKRLFIMIFFFGCMMLAAHLASNYQTAPSLAIIFLSNIYLFTKFSYHITLFGLNKTVFTRRTKAAGMNLFLIATIGLICSQKNKFINNNLVYKA